jgi:hypothetical protein
MNAIEHIQAPKTEEKQAKYFHFSQNNSGGSFHINDNVAHHVIVQAYTTEEANRLAEDIGIYFDGCNSDRDCSCCGDRWSRQWSDDKGDDTPMIYKDKPEDHHEFFTKPGLPICHVYHIDGSKTTYRKQEKQK